MTGSGFTNVRRKEPLSESWVAVVPVKDPARAKSRLDVGADAGVGRGADFAGRMGLARAFAEDVLTALKGAQGVKRIVVITDGNEASELAKSLGCESLIDPTESLNDAIKFAAGSISGESHICIWVSDLPCLQSADVETVLAQAAVVFAREREHEGLGRRQEQERRVRERVRERVPGRVRMKERGPTRAFVADDKVVGTTALLAQAPRYLTPHFGLDSAAAHKAAGAALLPGTPRARLDVDTQDDLRRAIALGVGPATQKALR
jgi:2-phospho-L-lactate guanylyltransferase